MTPKQKRARVVLLLEADARHDPKLHETPAALADQGDMSWCPGCELKMLTRELAADGDEEMLDVLAHVELAQKGHEEERRASKEQRGKKDRSELVTVMKAKK